MKTDDFNFDLPEGQIAQYPTGMRGESRLLVLDRASGALAHAMVADLASFVDPGTLMVFNDSRVRKARIFGSALDTGSEVEFLLLRRRGDGLWEAACTKAKRQRQGRRYAFPEGVEGEIEGGEGETRTIRFFPPIDEDWLDRVGHIPLPPYIKREDAPLDAERYQTIYSKNVGSSASPTAGLHFTAEILESLAGRGIGIAWVTLHVGLGTFLPVRTDRLEDHVMHREDYSVPAETAQAVARAK
ncbi:MAG: S-adenosylmethionine:tRNA ribosyltransferase-isomerase, partial [Rectinemataceae bacterium]|nr:S-adenosylmethionine:tRNA ribosyltransferase-isomerase [Rectinemataceae bacterium]